jgi:hypothetical protein
MTALKSDGVRRLVLVDYGKNIYAFYRGARQAGLEALAVADDLYAADVSTRGDSCLLYRGLPIMPVRNALALSPDALVISNTSYVHAAHRAAALAGPGLVPVHNWFPPPGSPRPRVDQVGPEALRVGVESMVSC